MKVLNLYSGIGGNRGLWGDDCEITAVELDKDIANVYKNRFPSDKVIIDDAHGFLLNNYHKYDFIWSSPPCQTHSSFRQNIGVRYRGVKAVYADMKLYQEIIFLEYNFNGKWVVENVKPYYPPLIKENIKLDRHLFWSNFKIDIMEFDKCRIRSAQIKDLELFHGIDLSDYKIKNKRQLLRNCVNKEVGRYIFNQSQKEVKNEL